MSLSNGSPADLLAFEAWPDEMKRIAREGVAQEIEDDDGDTPEAMEEWADAMWAAARKHLAIVVKKVKEGKDLLDTTVAFADAADASLTTAIEMLESLPEQIADLEALEE